MATRYVIACGTNYVSGFCEDGLLLVTHAVGGSTRHDGNGACNQAILFSKAEAEAAVKAYNVKRLPKGKAHSKLQVAAL